MTKGTNDMGGNKPFLEKQLLKTKGEINEILAGRDSKLSQHQLIKQMPLQMVQFQIDKERESDW